ncbi:hypothetical protein ASH01_19295 [Terrabacter sp. Soil811]|uniref:hypothetical protein n=1 Tax=Terrabacter sp. Soil811 TaxID=1736419 RepID=UPI0006FED6CB|nr:hypothetical protein [Terrabacter sp. Soil811]KRF39944.1 hypothetical protein ASH01_19295 [Terrabacter sp. Soil811]
MSSQSSTSTRLGRRSAAALGTSALVCLAVAGPVLASERPDPVSGSQPSSVSTSCGYVGGGSVVSCTDASSASSASSASGAGSANSAEQGTSAVVAPVARRIVLPTPKPSDLPVVGLGVAAAVVVAGGLLIASTNRRRPA